MCGITQMNLPMCILCQLVLDMTVASALPSAEAPCTPQCTCLNPLQLLDDYATRSEHPLVDEWHRVQDAGLSPVQCPLPGLLEAL